MYICNGQTTPYRDSHRGWKYFHNTIIVVESDYNRGFQIVGPTQLDTPNGSDIPLAHENVLCIFHICVKYNNFNMPYSEKISIMYVTRFYILLQERQHQTMEDDRQRGRWYALLQ